MEQRNSSYYDLASGDVVKYSPLNINTRYFTQAVLGEQEIMTIGAFGTCGNPNSDSYNPWRAEKLLPAFQYFECADDVSVFNPEVTNWNKGRASIEGIHLARDSVIVIPVTNDSGGEASTIEVGFAAYGSLLRGQNVSAFIDTSEGAPNRSARMLSVKMLKAIQSVFPANVMPFYMADNMDEMITICVANYIQKHRVAEESNKQRNFIQLPDPESGLNPHVFLSGTCGSSKPEWMKDLTDRITSMGVDKKQVTDSYVEGDYGEYEMDNEMHHKLNDAVQVIVITTDEGSDGLGALAELGPRMMYGDLKGQSVGLYLDIDKNQPDNTPSNRAKILAVEHINKLFADYRQLPLRVAKTPAQLAAFAVDRLNYAQQQYRMGGHDSSII